MNWANANQFLVEEVRSRWPEWKPTDMEVKDWCRVLDRYDKNTAKEAMFDYVADAKRITRRPMIAIFITKAKLAINSKPPEREKPFEPEPGKLYGKVARDKVFADIINGEDCAGKRFLSDFLRKCPNLIPAGVSLPPESEAEALPDDSIGSTLQTTEALGRTNPDYDVDYESPEDDIPF